MIEVEHCNTDSLIKSNNIAVDTNYSISVFPSYRPYGRYLKISFNRFIDNTYLSQRTRQNLLRCYARPIAASFVLSYFVTTFCQDDIDRGIMDQLPYYILNKKQRAAFSQPVRKKIIPNMI